jgi:lipid A disaccharide synthetase
MRIVQAYSDQNESLYILCEYETIGLMINYFNKYKSDVFPNLCTDNAILDKIIQEKFRSHDISLPTTSDLTMENKSDLAQDILKLENEMRSQNILMIFEQRHIRLFGLVDIVDKVEKQIEEIKKKYESNTVKLSIEPKQVQKFFFVKKRNLSFI